MKGKNEYIEGKEELQELLREYAARSKNNRPTNDTKIIKKILLQLNQVNLHKALEILVELLASQ